VVVAPVIRCAATLKAAASVLAGCTLWGAVYSQSASSLRDRQGALLRAVQRTLGLNHRALHAADGVGV
jgi:hypothetical protein